MTTTLDLPEERATMTLPGTLLDGGGIFVATAAWHLLKERQDRRRQDRAVEQAQEEEARDGVLGELDGVREEVSALRKIVDGIMVFLVGRKGPGGLPGPDGFLKQHEKFQERVLERLDAVDRGRAADHALLEQLASSLRSLEAEWRPNGGTSSYDRLRRVDERGRPDAPES